MTPTPPRLAARVVVALSFCFAWLSPAVLAAVLDEVDEDAAEAAAPRLPCPDDKRSGWSLTLIDVPTQALRFDPSGDPGCTPAFRVFVLADQPSVFTAAAVWAATPGADYRCDTAEVWHRFPLTGELPANLAGKVLRGARLVRAGEDSAPHVPPFEVTISGTLEGAARELKLQLDSSAAAQLGSLLSAAAAVPDRTALQLPFRGQSCLRARLALEAKPASEGSGKAPAKKRAPKR